MQGLAIGSTYYVATSGSNNNEGTQGSPFLTIQKAIESSSDGDTILVSAGTYYENLNVSNKTMVIIGEDNNTTIIDAENVGKAIYNSCSEPASFEIHNFTIQNGLSDNGSALYLNSVESAVINNCIIKNNTANNSIIFLDGGTNVSIVKTLIHNNTATNTASAKKISS